MIKKLIALSIVLLLPVTFISSASAASKSITCYKGTDKKVFKNSTGKCPTGWSSKKKTSTKTPINQTTTAYKIQDISTSEVAQMVIAVDDLKKQDEAHNANIRECWALTNYNYDDCAKKYPNPRDTKIKKYFPLTKKLLDNFCGLNASILAQNLSLLEKSDPLSGYEKFREVTMKPFYANLDKIEVNRKNSVNTSATDAFLNAFGFGATVSYNKDNYVEDKRNMLSVNAWDRSLARSEYGVSVSTEDYEVLTDYLRFTTKFCKQR